MSYVIHHGFERLGIQNLHDWSLLQISRLGYQYKIKFWHITSSLDLNCIAWFNHLDLSKIGLVWPFFVHERLILEVTKITKNSYANSNTFSHSLLSHHFLIKLICQLMMDEDTPSPWKMISTIHTVSWNFFLLYGMEAEKIFRRQCAL